MIELTEREQEKYERLLMLINKSREEIIEALDELIEEIIEGEVE